MTQSEAAGQDLRQAFIVGNGARVSLQAQALLSLGWAVTAMAWSQAAALRPSQVLVANLADGQRDDAAIRAWSRAAAVIVVVDRLDPTASNDLYCSGAVAVVEASAGAAMIAAIAERVQRPVATAPDVPEGEWLTMGERQLLQALRESAGTIVTYARLFHALGYARQDDAKNRRALATQIARLRKKLGARYRIRSRSNAGYALMPVRTAPAAIPLSDARRRHQSAAAGHAI